MKRFVLTILMCFITAGVLFSRPGGGIPEIETVLIPAGTLELGNTPKGDRMYFCDPKHDVTISKDFYMSKYEITNEQFARFLNEVGVGEDGMYTVSSGEKQPLLKASKDEKNWGLNWVGGKWVPAPGYDSHPVIYVSWYGADEFCRWAGGSLPTESQWEYACRGGAQGQFFGIGDGNKLYADMANIIGTHPYDHENGGILADYDGSTGHSNTDLGHTVKVGSYPYANAYGLYDMHGNVYEWCLDWHDLAYGLTTEELAGTVVDPTGPEKGEERIMRGGCFHSSALFCRSNNRNYAEPQECYVNVGFRIIFENQPR